MSGDQLDLDAIEARWGDQWHMAPNDVRALVAEVRRLREERDALRTSVAGLRASIDFKNGHIEDLAATVERLVLAAYGG